LTKGDSKLFLQKPCKGVDTDSQAKFGRKTAVGAYKRPKWVPHYYAQAGSWRGQDAQALLGSDQALLRLHYGMLTLRSG
jgi:hypothetical protein